MIDTDDSDDFTFSRILRCNAKENMYCVKIYSTDEIRLKFVLKQLFKILDTDGYTIKKEGDVKNG